MITFCISTFNNLPYLKIAIDSVRKNSHYKDAPFIIHAENCNDGTDKWLIENKFLYINKKKLSYKRLIKYYDEDYPCKNKYEKYYKTNR